jgi:hypothetical protein
MGDNHNHQDVREGGENPPLPRNCERPLETGDQPENHWSHRLREGGWTRLLNDDGVVSDLERA